MSDSDEWTKKPAAVNTSIDSGKITGSAVDNSIFKLASSVTNNLDQLRSITASTIDRSVFNLASDVLKTSTFGNFSAGVLDQSSLALATDILKNPTFTSIVAEPIHHSAYSLASDALQSITSASIAARPLEHPAYILASDVMKHASLATTVTGAINQSSYILASDIFKGAQLASFATIRHDALDVLKGFSNANVDTYKLVATGLPETSQIFAGATAAFKSAQSLTRSLALRDEALNTIVGSSFKFGTDSLVTSISSVKALDLAARPIIGPLADISVLSAINRIGSSDHMLIASQVINSYESLFKVPTSAEIASLNIHSGISNLLVGDGIDIAAISTKVNSPWLKISDATASVIAFAELNGLATSVSSIEPFGIKLLQGLRADFGDWRDVTIPVGSELTDITVRSNFYAEHDFRSELTDFPVRAFETSLAIADLTSEPPSLVDQYGEPIEPSADEDISAFARTNHAHLWLLRFETQIRNFIDTHLTATFGAEWPRHKLPNGMYEKWLDKQSKSEKAGMPPRSIIVFADFTDYELIITKRDIFPIFQAYFQDEANIREAFRRLQLPRLETMHARPLSQDDQLLLFAELKRLDRAFKKKIS